MNDTKRNPATPLPWKYQPGESECTYECSEEQQAGTETCDKCQNTSGAHISPFEDGVDCGDYMGLLNDDSAYIVHTANAYPRLVMALRIIAEASPDDDAPPDLALSLLRDLGEA